ncbi:MAG: hypothetical protein WA970_16245 [Gammaproteobacteria bacterium]|jgi:hypothetical protein
MGGSILLSVQVYLLGIFISFLVALLIRGVVHTLSAIKKKPTVVPAAPVVQAPVDFLKADIPAIAAAVYAVLGAHRIVHIESRGHGVGWTAEGRLTHHTSHNIVRRPRR